MSKLYGFPRPQNGQDFQADDPTLDKHSPVKSTTGCPKHPREWCPHWNDGRITTTGFSKCLIQAALIKHRQTFNVYILSRKLMTLCFFIHSKSKRAEAVALIDSGATKNFMNLEDAKYLQLPIKCLEESRNLFNVNGTTNKSGTLQYYTDLQVQTSSQWTDLRFFLTDLGENKAILGYPWFAAVQPCIDWKRGWVNHSQLLIIFWAPKQQRHNFYHDKSTALKTANKINTSSKGSWSTPLNHYP